MIAEAINIQEVYLQISVVRYFRLYKCWTKVPETLAPRVSLCTLHNYIHDPFVIIFLKITNFINNYYITYFIIYNCYWSMNI